MKRGIAKCSLQDLKGGVLDFTKTINFEPKNMDAYFNRGVAKFSLGQKESACLDLKKAGELGKKEVFEMIKKYCN